MTYRIFILLTCILSTLICKADKYKIKLQLNNCKDSVVYLAHYFDNKVVVIDSSQVSSKGIAKFTKKNKLHGGLYLIYLPSEQYADIIIGKDQSFSIKADVLNLPESLKIKGSKENKIFSKYQKFIELQKIEKNNIIKQYKQIEKNTDRSVFKKKINNLNNETRIYINKLAVKHPQSALSGFVNLTLEPNLNLLKKDSNNIEEKYYYYKQNYWKNISFSDSTIILSPIFKNKLDKYFNEVIEQNPDTILSEAIYLIENSKENKEMFKYLLTYCFNNSINSNIMGMDAVFVNLAKQYLFTKEANWLSKRNIANIKETLINTEHNLIGLKGKELNMPSIEGDWISLYETEAKLTILLFWEPNCAHCKKIIPEIRNILNKYKYYGLKIFAVYTQKNINEWEHFIDEYKLFDFIHCYDPHNNSNFRSNYNVFNTPVIYILDKNKKIIAKNIDVENIDSIISTLFSI